MNTAIIVAAGSGHRFGGNTPKQFLEIHGKPIIIHTIERFESCELVDDVVLVLAKSEMARFLDYASGYGFSKLSRAIPGGATRSDSVFNGLDSITAASAEIVAIHDGARPLVSAREIKETIMKAQEVGAACLVSGITDTLKEVSDSRILRTINRAGLRRALTPQCFRYEIIREAFAGAEIDQNVTDECMLVEKLGVEIAAVEGNPQNIKITNREDLEFLEKALMQYV